MRINKFFTDRGIMSRRAADRAVQDGRVAINGRPASPGDQVSQDDVITLDGQEIAATAKTEILLAYNKPSGVECTADASVENNIIDAIDFPERVFYIGRLDKYSEGLILLTNVGDLVNDIIRARHHQEKEYIVETSLPILDEHIESWREGIELSDGKTRPCQVERTGPARVTMILTEGRNRQIRRMAEAVGLRVRRLRRVRVMNINLGDLAPGKWRHVSAAERHGLDELIHRRR
jgi:23S rRNA pseudouridine2604 synthase